MRTDNPVRDYERYSSDLADREAKLPICDTCKKPIWDSKYYKIHGEYICKSCLPDYEVTNEAIL